MQLSKYQQQELDHLVAMALEDKREAWHAAQERAKQSPLLADMPRLLTERMQQAMKQPKKAAIADLSTTEWDRHQLEMAEARTLARSFQNKAWLDKALKASERVYGKGSSERIREHMKQIWKQELLK